VKKEMSFFFASIASYLAMEHPWQMGKELHVLFHIG
jgi:hypothetical protein